MKSPMIWSLVCAALSVCAMFACSILNKRLQMACSNCYSTTYRRLKITKQTVAVLQGMLVAAALLVLFI